VKKGMQKKKGHGRRVHGGPPGGSGTKDTKRNCQKNCNWGGTRNETNASAVLSRPERKGGPTMGPNRNARWRGGSMHVTRKVGKDGGKTIPHVKN